MQQDVRHIKQLQTMLRVIAAATGDIPTVIPDGIYGPRTAESVRAFQRAAGLPVTGQADAATWNRIQYAYEKLQGEVQEPAPLRIQLNLPPIGPGSDNAHIHLMQAMLRTLAGHYGNFPLLTVTGVYDAPTVAAVRSLQTCCGLPVTGAVDRATWLRLVSLYRLASGAGNF